MRSEKDLSRLESEEARLRRSIAGWAKVKEEELQRLSDALDRLRVRNGLGRFPRLRPLKPL